MYVSLLVLGVVAAAAGVAMIGYGIQVKEFSLGNTLLITGTISTLGGLILIGLAGAIGQLRLIAEALMARPIPRAAAAADPADAPKFQPRGRAPAPAEPRLNPGASDTSRKSNFDRPLFPPRNLQPASQGALADIVEEAVRMEIAAGSLPATLAEAPPVSRPDPSPRPSPPSDSAGPGGLFDALWPADSRPRKASALDAQPKPETAEAAPAHEEERGEGRKQNPHMVSILKSGMIDGMAYTLYSDGSIEAELPQGTVRFTSIAELRGHLEKSS
jgi:hypothetical protein